MKHVRNYVQNKKGINTILASLLMVVIVVVAAVMVYAWSTGLLGTLLVNPNNNKEGPLALDTNAAFPTASNTTLYIRNSGTLSVTLTSFYITDSSNDIWQDVSWTTAGGAQLGPTIAPNAVATLTIGIPTSGTNCWTTTVGGSTGSTTCSNVAGTGGTGAGTFNGGTFTSGQYTVKVITQRNNPFTFTITK